MIREVKYSPSIERDLNTKKYYLSLIDKYINDNLVNILDDEEYQEDLKLEIKRKSMISYYHEVLTDKKVAELLKNKVIKSPITPMSLKECKEIANSIK